MAPQPHRWLLTCGHGNDNARPSVPVRPRGVQRPRSDPPAVGARVADDQPDANRTGSPPSRGCDFDSQTSFSVEGAQDFVDVHDRRLEFDDDDRSSGGVPGGQIDDAALAADGQGGLGDYVPARLAGNPGGNAFAESGVPSTRESIEVAASHLATRSRRMPNLAAIARTAPTESGANSPWSSRETSESETPAIWARSCWRGGRRMRAARKARPSRMSSTGAG